MQKSPPKIKKFPAAKQRRMDHLLDHNREGTISPTEFEELKGLVREAEELMVENAKRLLEFGKGGRARPSADAVPVTVWVEPHRLES